MGRTHGEARAAQIGCMKNSMKLISIVLPVYNGEAYLADSIESILRQTYENWELIIVNDCSTDHTLAIAESYQKRDPRIRVFSNERNLKLPLTLNAGFAEAGGAYYTWTSDDNMYKPEALDRLVRALEQDDGCVLVYSDYTDIDADGREMGLAALPEPEKIVCSNVCGACFLYRAEAAKQAGQYDAGLFLAEDYDYWMRLYRIGGFRHIRESLYLYRRHAGSLTATKRALVDMQTYRAIEKSFLPLYADAKAHGLAYGLFDHMLRRVSDDRRDRTLQMLLSVDGGYRLYRIRCAVLKRLRAGLPRGIKTLLKGIMKR